MTGNQKQNDRVANRARIMGAILHERERQFEICGDQLLDDGIRPLLGAQLEAMARAQLNGPEDGTFVAVLLEEVGEAIAETDLRKLRVELVQVAAVCIQWHEDIDRRLERWGNAPAFADLDEAVASRASDIKGTP